MSAKAQVWIHQLNLSPHPEGGYFRENYRAVEHLSAQALPSRFAGDRALSTSIYFLLLAQQVSHFHRICSDEVWHFYTGAPLTIHCLSAEGYRRLPLNGNGDFQQVVPAGVWFGTTVDTEPNHDYALVGCTVSPGFDFSDFELAQAETLLKQWPEQAELIQHLTHSSGSEKAKPQ